MNSFPSAEFKAAVCARTVTLIPLLEVFLSDGTFEYLSDTELDLTALGGHFYHARLLEWNGITSAIDLTNASGTPSSTASFTLSNVDRALDDAASLHLFQRGSVVFKVYAPDVTDKGGTLAMATRTIWVGFIESTDYDDRVFTMRCRDGFFDLSLPLPRRRFSRTCEWTFDDGLYCPYSGYGYTGVGTGNRDTVPELAGVFAETITGATGDFGPDINGSEGWFGSPGLTQCDKTFGDAPGANGCKQHSMTRFFGGLRYVTSWSLGRTGASGFKAIFTGGHHYTSFSSLNDTIFDQSLPLVYCSKATGFTINPILYQWRPEQEYIAAECIIGSGPIGETMPPQNSDADYRYNAIGDVYLNGLPPHAGQNTPDHRGVNRAPGRIGDQLAWEVIGGDLRDADRAPGQTAAQPPVLFSAAAGFFLRVPDKNAGVNDPRQAEASQGSTPDVYASIKSGRRTWIYKSDGLGNFTRTYNVDTSGQGGCGNPAWILLDMILEAFDMKYSSIQRHTDLVDMQTFVDSAEYFGETITSLQNTQVMRYYWAGMVAELSPATDHIDSLLRDCHAFRFFRNGKIAIHPFTACQFDTRKRPAFQEFVNIRQGGFKPTMPKADYNELWLNYADKDFDFQKNTAQVYSQEYQQLMGGASGYPLKMTKTLNLMGTPLVEQATRLGLRMLRENLGGTSETEWAQVREADVQTTFMMTELEVGDVTYLAHTLMPPGFYVDPGESYVWGDWVRIEQVTINKDWTVTFKVRSWRASAYDDILATDPFVDLAKFPHSKRIQSGLGIVYNPNPMLAWADVDPIAALNVGMRLTWKPYPDSNDRARMRFVNIFRTTHDKVATGGYLLQEVDGATQAWLVASDSCDFAISPYHDQNLYLVGTELVRVGMVTNNGNGTTTINVTRGIAPTSPESHQKYQHIRHSSFLDQLPGPTQVQALVSGTQYIDPSDTSI